MKIPGRSVSKRNYLQSLSVLSFILMVFILATSCGDGQRAAQRAQKEKLEEVKRDAQEAIELEKTQVKERIEFIEEKIEEVSGDTQEELEKARNELKEQLSKLDKEKERVKNASLDVWQEVIGEVQQAFEATRKKRNEISAKVRDMLED